MVRVRLQWIQSFFIMLFYYFIFCVRQKKCGATCVGVCLFVCVLCMFVLYMNVCMTLNLIHWFKFMQNMMTMTMACVDWSHLIYFYSFFFMLFFCYANFFLFFFLLNSNWNTTILAAWIHALRIAVFVVHAMTFTSILHAFVCFFISIRFTLHLLVFFDWLLVRPQWDWI